MVTLLALSLLLPPSAPAYRADPPIQLKLSDDFYFRGEKAKVRFKSERDGYLLVLRLDGNGRIRPLFPVDPSDTAFVRGGREFEVRSRGDRDAFTVDEREGTGYVIAAISEVPFDMSGFTRGTHWDLRALSDFTRGDDPETILLDLVDSMATAEFDYDLASYTVGADRRNRAYRSHPYGWGRYYDPWFHSYDPFYHSPFGFRFGIVFGGHRRYRRWW